MKKFLFPIVLFFITFSLQAQVVNTFLDKYGRDTYVEIVTIGKRMLEKMQSESMATSELKDAIEGVENIKIVSSKEDIVNDDYYQSASKLIAGEKQLREVLSMDKQGGALRIFIKETDGSIEELIILSKDDADFYFVSLTGDIQWESLVNYSKITGAKGLEELNKIQ